MRHTRLSATALAGPRVPRDALTRDNLYATGSHVGYPNGDQSPPCKCHRRRSPLGLTFPGAATYGSQPRLDAEVRLPQPDPLPKVIEIRYHRNGFLHNLR